MGGRGINGGMIFFQKTENQFFNKKSVAVEPGKFFEIFFTRLEKNGKPKDFFADRFQWRVSAFFKR